MAEARSAVAVATSSAACSACSEPAAKALLPPQSSRLASACATTRSSCKRTTAALAAKALPNKERGWSLAELTSRLLSRQLDKRDTLRCSDWEAAVLSPEQVEYAALDAWASFAVYQKLSATPAAAALLAQGGSVGGCLSSVPRPLPETSAQAGQSGRGGSGRGRGRGRASQEVAQEAPGTGGRGRGRGRGAAVPPDARLGTFSELARIMK